MEVWFLLSRRFFTRHFSAWAKLFELLDFRFFCVFCVLRRANGSADPEQLFPFTLARIYYDLAGIGLVLPPPFPRLGSFLLFRRRLLRGRGSLAFSRLRAFADRFGKGRISQYGGCTASKSHPRRLTPLTAGIFNCRSAQGWRK